MSWNNSLQRRTHHDRTRASSAEGERFKYPGFDFRRIEKIDAFGEARKEIIMLTKEKSLEKSLENRRTEKRIDFSNEKSKGRKLFRGAKMRGSAGHGKENKTK